MNYQNLGLLVRTLRHVPPNQIYHRIRLRSQRAVYQLRPDGLEERWAGADMSAGSWPRSFRPIDLEVDHAAPTRESNGELSLSIVGETTTVTVDGWRPASRSQLHRYHLHYFEWAWPLAVSGTDADRDLFAELWRSWRNDTQAGRWDEWSPYVVSLRAWVLCGVFGHLVAGTEVADDVQHHLRACLGFLARNLEQDVGGNHLVKNLKALAGLAIFFDDEAALHQASAALEEQVQRQVLDDGGHYEMSPSYHAQVMADFADLASILAASDRQVPPAIERCLPKMADWLAAMTYPDGSLPLIGDCTPPPPGLLDALRRRFPSAQPGVVSHLTATGYVVLRPAAGTMVVADFGPPCPRELPAHAQADWGTFELWHDGERLIADPGVSTYVGERRAWERSHQAHNTIHVEGHHQTECWSSFRAARRLHPRSIVVSSDGGTAQILATAIWASGLHHERQFRVTPSSMEIYDRTPTHNGPLVASLTTTSKANSLTVRGSETIPDAGTCMVGIGFGEQEAATRYRSRGNAGRHTWQLTWATVDDPTHKDDQVEVVGI